MNRKDDIMAIRRDIPLEEFSIIISPPANRLESTCVNIHSDGRFNLNGKLAEKLGGKKIRIQFTPDCRYLCLQEGGDISIPKGGSRKIEEISKLLKKNGVLMPAKYELFYSETTRSWQGEREPNPIKPPSRRVRSTKM